MKNGQKDITVFEHFVDVDKMLQIGLGQKENKKTTN